MQLIRCKDQQSETLDEFYSEISLHNGSSKIGAAMLDLINRLREFPDDRQLFGLTSMYRLCLLAKDTWESPWYVTITAHDKTMYWVEYLLPQRQAPWPDAFVMGEAHSVNEAVEMILIGMEKSGGWKGQGNKVRGRKNMNIEYIEDGSIDSPLVLIYGNDPAGVEILRRSLDRLVNDIVDDIAIHELPGFQSVDECRLFAQKDRDDLGVWRPNSKEKVFICAQQKETWIDVIEKLRPFTDPHTYIYTGGCFQYLTDPTRHTRINLMISTRRGW